MDGRSVYSSAYRGRLPLAQELAGSIAGHVLVIDDDTQAVDVIGSVLAKLGDFSIRVAYGRDECLQLVRLQVPDLIILNIGLPQLDGLAVLRHLRSSAESAHVPILIVSADAQLERMAASFEAGASGFLIKPFDSASLYQQVRSAISPHHNGT